VQIFLDGLLARPVSRIAVRRPAAAAVLVDAFASVCRSVALGEPLSTLVGRFGHGSRVPPVSMTETSRPALAA
jgi:hypothetical protein